MSQDLQNLTHTLKGLAGNAGVRAQRAQLRARQAAISQRHNSLMLDRNNRLYFMREELERRRNETASLTGSNAVLESRTTEVDRTAKDKDKEEDISEPEAESTVQDTIANLNLTGLLSYYHAFAPDGTASANQLAQRRAIMNENTERITARAMELDQRLVAEMEGNNTPSELATLDLERYDTAPETQPIQPNGVDSPPAPPSLAASSPAPAAPRTIAFPSEQDIKNALPAEGISVLEFLRAIAHPRERRHEFLSLVKTVARMDLKKGLLLPIQNERQLPSLEKETKTRQGSEGKIEVPQRQATEEADKIFWDTFSTRFEQYVAEDDARKAKAQKKMVDGTAVLKEVQKLKLRLQDVWKAAKERAGRRNKTHEIILDLDGVVVCLIFACAAGVVAVMLYDVLWHMILP